jgi:hypothetical protein
MAFEVFDSKASKRVISDRPVIGIQANGVFRFNMAATAHLAKMEKVILLWDRQDHKLAIANASTDDTRAYRISYGHGGARIVPRAFLKHIRFTAASTVSVPAEFVKGMLQATLPAENLPSENTQSKDDSAQKSPVRKKKSEL